MGEGLRAVLAPRSVAVVGVSSRPESLSGRLLDNLLAFGFTGEIYPVNPKADVIRSLRCYPTVAEIPRPVDLAVLMVPRTYALAAVEDCIAASVGGVVVVTAGFREGGGEGVELERQLVTRLRHAGVRMIGPNCMGLINTSADVRLDATFSPVRASPGSVAFLSHSGALGVATLEGAVDAGLGFSTFVSVGNAADVTVVDLLEELEHDPDTRSIMLYLESIEDPRRFLEVAGRITRRKPIVALKAGRTAAGQKAASSHTGALAAADTAVDAVFAQAGVIRAESLAEMFDVAVASQLPSVPAGRRIAVITNAGGPAIVAMDAVVAHGLEPATLAEATLGPIREALPPEAAVGNPIDMLPSALPEDYRRAVEGVLADDGVDAALVITVTPILTTPIEVARAIGRAAATSGKPVVTAFMTSPSFYGEARKIGGVPPVYRYPESAVRALAGLVRHREQVDRRGETRFATAVVSPTLEAFEDAGYLPMADAFAVLEEIGVSVAPWRMVPARSDTVAAAEKLGYPVVLKAVADRLVHKTEVGAVVVGIADGEAMAEATTAMIARLAAVGVEPEGFLVQRQITEGREVILGLTRDSLAGTLVMCGMGGVAVEVWKDVAFRLAPVDETEAGRMLDGLSGGVLLGAFRGRPAGDLAALKKTVSLLSALGAAYPRVAECDINPLLVLDDGLGCVAVDVRIRMDRP